MNRWQLGQHYQKLAGVLAGWVGQHDPAHSLQEIAEWDADQWQSLKRCILMHGVGAYLSHFLPTTPLYAALPSEFHDWLTWQQRMNSQRITALQGDLIAILRAANQVGIAVMPLKGFVLAAHYPAPNLRPMADLDLLVQPSDYVAMGKLLQSLGYCATNFTTDAAYHETFNHQIANQVVSVDCEHPDNPRSVELFCRLKRQQWYGANFDLQALQPFDSSQPGTLFGERIQAPTQATLLHMLLTHANKHLLRDTGRLIQLLDLAMLAPFTIPADPHWANWLYPPVCLASRLLPDRFRKVDLGALAKVTHPAVRAWCENSAFSEDLGFITFDQSPQDGILIWDQYLYLLWNQWRPTPWRVATAFGDAPLSVAYGRYAKYLGYRGVKKAKEMLWSSRF